MKHLIAALALFMGSQAWAVPMISLAPSATGLSFNQPFTVDVLASGISPVDPLLAFGFDVMPGADIAFDGATAAAPFFDDSALFIDTDVAGSAFPALFGDDIRLATLQFTTGVTEGLLDIDIGTSPAALGVSEGLFTVFGTADIASSISVEVSRPSLVPVAGTLPLLLLGLVGLIGIANRTHSS